MPRHRRTAMWGAAGLLPVALGVASTVGGVGAAAPAGSQTGAVPDSSSYVAVTDAIPRLLLDNPSSELSDSWEKPTPNKSTFANCGWFGSAGSDQETNHRKNRTDLPPSYHAITFEALVGLDWPHEAKTRRDKWTTAQLADIAPFEGEAVAVTGFVVALRPQARNSEATNCGKTGEDSTDWHVALVGDFGDPESKAVVVEPTPRIKRMHPNWTPDALKPAVGSKDSVRVSGYLLLDPVHKGHLGKYRQTLWEVHPIHRIEVFQSGKWRDLDGG